MISSTPRSLLLGMLKKARDCQHNLSIVKFTVTLSDAKTKFPPQLHGGNLFYLEYKPKQSKHVESERLKPLQNGLIFWFALRNIRSAEVIIAFVCDFFLQSFSLVSQNLDKKK